MRNVIPYGAPSPCKQAQEPFNKGSGEAIPPQFRLLVEPRITANLSLANLPVFGSPFTVQWRYHVLRIRVSRPVIEIRHRHPQLPPPPTLLAIISTFRKGILPISASPPPRSIDADTLPILYVFVCFLFCFCCRWNRHEKRSTPLLLWYW